MRTTLGELLGPYGSARASSLGHAGGHDVRTLVTALKGPRQTRLHQVSSSSRSCSSWLISDRIVSEAKAASLDSAYDVPSTLSRT